MVANRKQVRVGKKLELLLVDIKNKNNFRSVGQAADHIADYLNDLRRKKRVRQRIIREIEF